MGTGFARIPIACANSRTYFDGNSNASAKSAGKPRLFGIKSREFCPLKATAEIVPSGSFLDNPTNSNSCRELSIFPPPITLPLVRKFKPSSLMIFHPSIGSKPSHEMMAPFRLLSYSADISISSKPLSKLYATMSSTSDFNAVSTSASSNSNILHVCSSIS